MTAKGGTATSEVKLNCDSTLHLSQILIEYPRPSCPLLRGCIEENWNVRLDSFRSQCSQWPGSCKPMRLPAFLPWSAFSNSALALPHWTTAARSARPAGKIQ